jgi:hypothetical protein
LIAKLTWERFLANKKCIFFIDNEAARIGLIRGYSPVLPSLKLILESAMWDYRFDCKSWYFSPLPPLLSWLLEMTVVEMRVVYIYTYVYISINRAYANDRGAHRVSTRWTWADESEGKPSGPFW